MLTAVEWDLLLLSAWVAMMAVATGLPLALWVAHLLAGRRIKGWWLLNIVVHIPLVLPPVVVGYGLLLIFAPTGWVGRLLDGLGLSVAFTPAGAALAAGIMAFPLMVRSFRQAREAIDDGLLEAAHTLGASKWETWCAVTWPLMRGGVISGVVLGLAKALGEFGATITFVAAIPGRTQTLPSAIYAGLQVPGQEDAVLRLVLISVGLSIGALILSELLIRRKP